MFLCLSRVISCNGIFTRKWGQIYLRVCISRTNTFLQWIETLIHAHSMMVAILPIHVVENRLNNCIAILHNEKMLQICSISREMGAS